MDPGRYCREVESYLCRRNDGHLIRIVGPAFELVCGWAERQIPLRVVCGAIDRTRARYYAKGPRRRPIRIEFCEADVLELFDEWRRAVGVGTAATTQPSSGRATRRPSLSAHIDRVVDRLTALCDSSSSAFPFPELVTVLVDELRVLRETAHTARGGARQQVVGRLTEIEHGLVESLRRAVEPDVMKRLQVEALQELEPYRERMPPQAFAKAREAGADRLLYDHFGLPRIVFD